MRYTVFKIHLAANYQFKVSKMDAKVKAQVTSIHQYKKKKKMFFLIKKMTIS